MRFDKKMEYIKRVLKTPMHMYVPSTNTAGHVLLILEDEKGTRYKFPGATMSIAIDEAYLYIETEIKNGSMTDPDKKSKKQLNEEIEDRDEVINLDEEK